MASPEWRKRVKKAWLETANLSAFTILAVASLLTLDLVLLCVGSLVEILYLVFASRSTRYEKRLEAREQAGAVDVPFLDRVLLVVTVAGFVVILFFGFGKHLLSHLFPYLSHAQGWEVGAIGWTTLFLVYYLAKFKGAGASSNDGVHNIILVFLVFFYSALLVLAWLTKGEPRWHVFVIMWIGLCFCSVDYLSMKRNPVEKERLLSRNSLHWADIPMVVAVFVLWVYLLIHHDAENSEVFVSGVISCQLLISNAVFVAMEFDLGALLPVDLEKKGHDGPPTKPQE